MEVCQPLHEAVVLQVVVAAVDDGVIAGEVVEFGDGRSVDDDVAIDRSLQQQGRHLVDVVGRLGVGTALEKGLDPVPGHVESAGRVFLDRGQALGEPAVVPGTLEVSGERIVQFGCGAADDESRVGVGEFGEEILGGFSDEVVVEQPLVGDELFEHPGQRGDVGGLCTGAGKGEADAAETPELRGDAVLGRFVPEAGPEDLGHRSRARVVTEQSDPRVHLQQGAEDLAGVTVVNALDVALGVPWPHELLHHRQPGVGFHRQHLVPFRQFLAAQGFEQPVCQVLAPVHLGRFADDVLSPQLPGCQEVLVSDRFEEVGAGQVQGHLVITEDGRQIQLLDVDREVVVAHLDDVVTADEQVLAILELPDGVLADRLQSTLDVVDLDAVLEFLELVDDVADLVDHQVRGEVAVDVVDAFEGSDSALDSAQDSLGR